jgi:hypothetical protein
MTNTVRGITIKFLFIVIPFISEPTFIHSIAAIPLEEGVFRENIKTVQIFRSGWKLSYPVIELNGDVNLELSFDDFSDRVNNYSYKIIHCDFNWNPSPLSDQDYIKGFRQNLFYDYSFSFNTYFRYVHFKLNLPNNDVKFLISGNYVIEVINDSDGELVFRKRFIVTEPLVNIIAEVQRPVLSSYRNTCQQINFNIVYNSYRIDNPLNDIKVAILQNGRWDNAIFNLKPLFDKNRVLEYNYNLENLFSGNNEYRWFDIKSTRYQSAYIKDVIFKDGYFHVYLFPEEINASKQYFYSQDLNGKYYIEVQEGSNNDLDSDYIYVHFNLPYEPEITNGNFYVMGALSDNLFSEINKMNFNPETKAYELTLLLKQGYYNYRYEVLKKGMKKGDPSITEGSYYETENDYIILVYYHGISSRYDRIIGYQFVNSLRK